MASRHRKPTEGDLLGVVDAIYAASVDPEAWTTVLRRIVDVTGGEVAGIVEHSLRDGRATVHTMYGTDEQQTRAYERDWAPRNIYLHASGVPVRQGAVRLSHELVPLREALRTEYVNDFLLREGVLHIMGSVLRASPSSAVILHILRARHRECFDTGDVAVMERLLPHIRRAEEVRRRLADVDLRHRAAVEGLDRLTIGVVFLDERGMISFSNRAADRMLSAGDGLSVRAGKLRAVDAREHGALERAVSGACGREGELGPSGDTLLISRAASGRQPLVVMVAALTREVPGPWATGPAAIVFITDPHATAPDAQMILRRLYGLTPAEANFARHLVEGGPLEDLADRLGVTLNTARTHVKRLLMKTSTRSQRELMQVLMAATLASRLGESGGA